MAPALPSAKTKIRPCEVSFHLVRSVSSNYLNKCNDVPKNAISLMLAHSMPTAPEDMSRTTREFYVTCQSMPDKTTAMRAWTDALFTAYDKAGGKFPMPGEIKNKNKNRPK